MRPFLTLFFVTCSTLTFCQDLVEFKEFYTRDDDKTDESHAYYYSVGKRIGENGFCVDTVYSYYTPSNIRKSTRVFNDKGSLDGKVFHYHENGKLKYEGNYEAGKRVGNHINLYADGTSHRKLQYFDNGSNENSRILDYWDSTGVQLVKTGFGFCECYLDSDYIKENGRVKDGVKDSLWSGFRSDTLIFKENYSGGKLINGKSYHKRKEFLYDKIEIPAEFPGGINGLFGFLSHNFRYPSDARRSGTQGKVFVQFIVMKDGSLSNIKILKGVSSSLDKESLRIVGMMPKWTPALQRGRPVKSKFVLPVVFKLQG